MVGVGLLMAPGGLVSLADAVERAGFAKSVADLAAQSQGLLVVLGCLRVVTLPKVEVAEVVQHVGFTGPVAEFAVQSQGLLVVLGSLLVLALPRVDDAEAVER